MLEALNKLFPATENFTEIRAILDYSHRLAYLFSRSTFTVENIVAGYMKYIEQSCVTGNDYYKIFPWYTKSTQYMEITQLDRIEENSSRKIKISKDVLLLSKHYQKHLSSINMESFYYLMVYTNIHYFRSQYLLPDTSIGNSSLLCDTNFWYFLQQPISHKFSDIIREKQSRSTQELYAWISLQKGYHSIEPSEAPIYTVKREKNDLFHKALKTDLTKDITYLAYTEDIPITVGRNAQISRLVDILSKVNKHNAILLGNPGVGKKSIVYGLAQKIIYNDVPRSLANCAILEYDSVLSIAGCQYRGSFETKMQEFVTDLSNLQRKIILFIDDIDEVINLGNNEQGSSLSFASMITKLLGIPDLKIVGTTTLSGIRRIEKNKSFKNMFNVINIEEPSLEDTFEILENVSHKFRTNYGITIPKNVLKTTIILSSRFITDRFLPDKAIDVLDETCAIKCNSSPINSDNTLTEEDVTNCISKMKDIPVNKIQKSINLCDLEKHLSSQVIGQNEAIEAVSKAIRRAQAGLTDSNKPLSSFLFIGPTGVGKTEIAKVLADTMFPGGRENMIRLDMSEYMEKNSVSKLIGAAPGYIGYEESGQLTEKVKHHPYSLVLFDEFEKAHPSICNILLQILDEGWLTDGHGERIDFKNTIIILTSNVGSKNFTKKQMGFGTASSETIFNSKKHDVETELKSLFPVEFLNRIDDIIQFNQLNHESILQITHLIINNSIISKMTERNIQINISEDVINKIALIGYSPEYGARAIKRTVIRELINPLSDFLLQHNEVNSISIQLNNDSIKITESSNCVVFN